MAQYQLNRPREWSTSMAEVLERAGGINALARALSITPSAIYQWQGIPADRVELISQLTGIPKEQLRPDIWDMGT